MNKDNFEWVENVPNLPDKSIVTLIKGISRRVRIVEREEVSANLETRLGVLEEEAEKRGLTVGNT